MGAGYEAGYGSVSGGAPKTAAYLIDGSTNVDKLTNEILIGALTSPLTFSIADAATSSVTDIISFVHTTSGTAAAGFGVGLLFTAESAGGSNVNICRLGTEWDIATGGSEESTFFISLAVFDGTLERVFDVEGDGPIVRLIGGTAGMNNDPAILLDNTSGGEQWGIQSGGQYGATDLNFFSNDISSTQGLLFKLKGSTTPYAILINDLGLDCDTRMEGDTNANLFFLDASQDTIGIGGASTAAMLLHVNQPAASSGTPTAFRVTPGAHTALTSATQIDVWLDLARTVQFSTGALADQYAVAVSSPGYGFVGASVLTNPSTVLITSCPSRADNATFTSPTALNVGGTNVGIGPTSSGLNYSTIKVPAHTVTVTGTTQVTASPGFAAISLGQVTASDTSAATVDTAATLYIANAPNGAGAGPVTITNTYAAWIDAGASRFDGRVMWAKGADVASGGTVTLLNGGNYFDVTGTTAIDFITVSGQSGIPNWTAGSIIVLQFDGAASVNHNAASPPAGTAPILLQAAGSFAAGTDDTLTLVYDGVTWRELARTTI